MAINKLTVLCLLLMISAIGLNFQCKKKIGCADTIYNFELGVKGFPDLDSVNIGDSIWFEINSPTQFKDINGQLVEYNNAGNLGSSISFYALSNLGQFTVKSVNKFNYSLIEGVQKRITDDIIEYTFSEKNGAYQFKLALIAKEKGIYSIIFSNAANVYRINDKCTKANFIINFKNTNQHYYLNPNFTGGTPVGGDYYFKVK